jgi:hypothetical protein
VKDIKLQVEDEMDFLQPSEELRLKLLQEEFKLRKKQPEAWTKTKFRPYANFRCKKKEEA